MDNCKPVQMADSENFYASYPQKGDLPTESNPLTCRMSEQKKLKSHPTETYHHFVYAFNRNESPGDAQDDRSRVQHGRFIYACESPVATNRVRTNHAPDDFSTMRAEDAAHHCTFTVTVREIASIDCFSEFGLYKQEIVLGRGIRKSKSDTEAQDQD